jgi:UDPglucose 6-dehydrogenase
MDICYVGGCGRLGYPMAVWTAACGFSTIIVDKREDAVAAVLRGDYSSPEPEVDRFAREARQMLTATLDIGEAVEVSDIIFVLVQTPSKQDGGLSLDYVLEACKSIGKALAETDQYKVVSISSTVMPGDVEGPILDVLEQESGKAAHVDFGLVYCPEFIRQGSIVYDFSCPDFVVIGYLNEREVDVMESYYQQITRNAPTIHKISIPSAEIAKIGLNTAVVAKIARANEIMLLCHRTSGADARDVLKAIGSDPRIGNRYFSPGLPPGGPCFPRDNVAMVKALADCGLHHSIAHAVRTHEQYQIDLLFRLIMCYIAQPMHTVGILGLTYKPCVDLTVGSQGEKIARFLHQENVSVLAYDPAVKIDGIRAAESLDDLVENSNVLVLMTCWHEFRKLNHMDLTGKTVIDCWGFLNESLISASTYVRLGKGPTQ